MVIDIRKPLKTFARLGCCLTLLIAATSEAQQDEPGQFLELCSGLERQINLLVTYTQTKCIPGTGATKGTVDLILLSEKSVFTSDAHKKGWLMVVVAAVGKAMNDNPRRVLGRIVVSDLALTAQRRAFWLPASIAPGLQRQVHSGGLELDEFYRRISGALKEFPWKTVP
jgi:hypothetical protein